MQESDPFTEHYDKVSSPRQQLHQNEQILYMHSAIPYFRVIFVCNYLINGWKSHLLFLYEVFLFLLKKLFFI